jgi:hypothetical protein
LLLSLSSTGTKTALGVAMECRCDNEKGASNQTCCERCIETLARSARRVFI